MKFIVGVVLSFGSIFFADSASAVVNTQAIMALCQNQDGSQSLRLSRHFLKTERGLIELFDRPSETYKRLPATVVYTNAGARAIFSYAGNQQLIVTGGGQSSVVFDSQLFRCSTDF